MSVSLVTSGTGSKIRFLFPELHLSTLGLGYIMTGNTIPNMEEGVNNMFPFICTNDLDENGNSVIITYLSIPTGCYKIEDIANYIVKEIRKDEKIYIGVNEKTFKMELKSNIYVDFTQKNVLTSLLGFELKVLDPDVLHTTENKINIAWLNAIWLKCSKEAMPTVCMIQSYTSSRWSSIPGHDCGNSN